MLAYLNKSTPTSSVVVVLKKKSRLKRMTSIPKKSQHATVLKSWLAKQKYYLCSS